MQSMPWDEWVRRCQKPDHDRIGNWMARRISRPAALRITWLLAPWGVSANAVTLAAWSAALVAAWTFSWGSIGGWILGAILLQLWYLLDHVDGQLARLHGSSSLDGVQLDYLMHHTVNLLVPLGIGWGLFVQSGQPRWMLLGTLWGTALLLVTLQHDARYKAFILRLKRLRGQLLVQGGGGYRPLPPPPIPRHPLRFASWLLQKLCELHVVMNLLSAIALCEWFCRDFSLSVARAYLLVAAPVALVVAVGTVFRSQYAQAVEQEFDRWFRPEPGATLTYRDGWWTVLEPLPEPQEEDEQAA